jgi:bifunctional UDP-N-acetylglucosamine pyrophosphorylase / glucosamine-1-phosphate N-acetyltransferase
VLFCLFRPHRLTVRTAGFQSVNRSSILREVTASLKEVIYHFFSLFRSRGDVAEWLKASVSKTDMWETASRVQIPLSPQIIMKHTEIIILAGGKGKRMESDIPKALTPLRGKPFIRYILDELGKITDKKPIIVVGYKKESIIDELGGEYRYAVQENPLGTGHAVMSAISHVVPESKNILVLYSDQPLLKGETIRKMIEKHEESNSLLTMATVPIPSYDGWYGDVFGNFGRIVRSSDGTIQKIIEHKDATEIEKQILEVNPACFCFDSAWLWSRLAVLKNENAQGEYYLTDMVGTAFDEGITIQTISIDPLEAVGTNTKQQLELLEKLLDEQDH